MSRHIILTHGLPGSGKSTWAIQEAEKNAGKIVRINRDDLRTEIAGEQYHRKAPNKRVEGQVTQEQDKRIKQALAHDKVVILDNTNLNPRAMQSIARLANDYGATVQSKYFDTPIEECKRRNANRDRVVPEHVIDRMAEQGYCYDKSQLKRWTVKDGVVAEARDLTHPDEQFLLRFNATLPGAHGITGIEGKNGRKLAITFDFDGTLSDTREISDKFMSGNKKNFHAFHMESLNTQPNEDVVKILNETRERGIGVVGLTARQSRYAEVTTEWVKKHGIELDALYMRAREDYRPDYTVKSEIIREIENDGWDICHAVDDNPQVLRRWGELGIYVTAVPWHTPVYTEEGEEKPVYEKQVIPSPFASGGCIRCGKPLKKGFIGPKCQMKS